MGFRSFSLRLALRLALRVVVLTVLLSLMIFLLVVPGYPTVALLVALLAILSVAELLRLVNRTNNELTRFLDAVRYADYGQRFRMQGVGQGFDELGEAFTHIITRFQSERTDQEQQLRHLQALTEHVPVPLLSLEPDGRIQLHNNAARRLFASARVNRLEDLAAFGEELGRALVSVLPGEQRLVPFLLDGMEQRLTMSATEIATQGRMQKLVSLQNIQSELDSVQLQAWQELVRVLTHEIMNSITPVASLARTASDLVDDATCKLVGHPEVVHELADVKSAVDTVARRSDGLMQFVQSYRRLTRLPPPDKCAVRLEQLFDSVRQLIDAQWDDDAPTLDLRVEPQSLEVSADRDMLEQILLNIVQNAAQALADQPAGTVEVLARLNRHGHVMIEITDNGPGVAAEIADKIFVPFFTTRRDGSGVGLALTRQVMLAHGGNAALGQGDSGGARFTLTF